MQIPIFSDFKSSEKKPEVLFWVGCAGSFDDRAKKVTKVFARLLIKAKVDFAVLGKEESCTGDPAKRAGNEFVFQMQALKNIKTLNQYGVKKIVTTCPHCFNTLKNEYLHLGGSYEVMHHTQFLKKLLIEGRLSIENGAYKGKRITYHDSCYLGRANSIYEIPRELIKKLDAELVEMKSCKRQGLCCGAGGAQMFKEPEKGDKDINIERIEEALDTKPNVIVSACPFCNVMLSDGIKNKKTNVNMLDIVELIANAQDL